MWDTFLAGLAGLTGACAALNGAHFLRYLRRPLQPPGRRLAALVLSTLHWGLAAQYAAVLLDAAPPAPLPEPPLSAAGRILVAAGVLAVSALIARRGTRR